MDSRLLLSTLLVSALAFTACEKKAQQEAKKKDGGPVQVRIAPVATRQLTRVVESVGTLYPYDEVVVSAEIEGRITEVNYDLGDTVKEGAVLARVSDEEQRYILAQNEAQLRQSLERLGLKDEKDRVREINETPEVRRAQADLTEASQRHKRLVALVDQKIGAQSDLDAASARLQAMKAAYDSTLNQTRNLIQEVERFKAIVELQRKKLRDTTVRAPFAASVKERTITQGAYVRPNAPLFTLVRTSQLRLRLEIPERMAPWTKVGQICEVRVEAFADRVFRGRIWRVAPTVEQTKRTFVAEALIDNPDGVLKAGSYARGKLTTEKVDTIHVVPSRAVTYVLGTNKAFVVNDAGVVDARDVKLGERFENEVEITEGLQPGEKVATTGVNRLDTGSKVTILTGPEPNRKGGAPRSASNDADKNPASE
jgi:RND family efflux transporter MFP subunit